MITPGIIIGYTGGNSNIPSNFERYTNLDDTFVKIANTLSGDLTGGAENHSHTSAAHTHAMNSHSHTVNISGNNNTQYEDTSDDDNGNGAEGHQHDGVITGGIEGGSISDAVTYGSTSHVPPFVRVIFIKATGHTLLPQNGLVFWDSNTAPVSDELTLYANDDTFLRGAAIGGDAGATGGSADHTHSLDHSHAAVTHRHLVNTPAAHGSTDTLHSGTGGGPATLASHTHSLVLNSSSSTPSSYVGSKEFTDILPAYKKIAAYTSDSLHMPIAGICALWDDDAANLPANWEQVTTYDDKFMQLTTTISEVGDTGGSHTHSHAANTPHTHTATTSHSHSGTVSEKGTDNTNTPSGGDDVIKQHDHTVDGCTSTTASWGSANVAASDTQNNEPPYRKLMLIRMKFPLTSGASIIPRVLS